MNRPGRTSLRNLEPAAGLARGGEFFSFLVGSWRGGMMTASVSDAAAATSDAKVSGLSLTALRGDHGDKAQFRSMALVVMLCKWDAGGSAAPFVRILNQHSAAGDHVLGQRWFAGLQIFDRSGAGSGSGGD